MKTADSKLEIRGGTPEEQAEALAWQAMFLTPAQTDPVHQPSTINPQLPPPTPADKKPPQNP